MRNGEFVKGDTVKNELDTKYNQPHNLFEPVTKKLNNTENKKMSFSTSSFRPYVKNESNTFSSDHFNIPEKKMTDTEKNFILNYVDNLSDNEENFSDNEDLDQ